MIEATIETPHPYFPNRSLRPSRVSDVVRWSCCIEHDFARVSETKTGVGTKGRAMEVGVRVRSSTPPRREVGEWRQKSSREQNHSQKLRLDFFV